ncbi:MAG: DUF445 domain-containing protein [Methylocystis sp.]|uniref:DUF445 domain-containing protein n=1 Tax=Methylocystis sp. TaxID=1911079 RepID=UPI003DA67B44
MTADASPRRAPFSRRTLATGLLLAMAGVFLLTLAVDQDTFWLRLLRSVAEAALVGGVADWFAVTALFRRPLGLPIPHTAIVPMSKARIGAGLANFLGENFLSAERLALTLRAAQPARRLGVWLSKRANARLVSTKIVQVFARSGAAPAILARALAGADPGRLVDLALEGLEASELDGALLDEALRGATAFLHNKSGRLEERAGRRRQGVLRRTLDREVMRAVTEGLARLFDELSDKDHPSRQRLLAAMRTRTRAAFAHADTTARLQEWTARFAANPHVATTLAAFLDAPDGGALREALEDLLVTSGERLRADEAAQREFESLLLSLTEDLSLLRHGVMQMIAEGARAYDTTDFSNRIERAVNDDLQFIRINGTVVGALVGCLLFVAKSLGA